MKYIISIFILSLVGCSSAPETNDKIMKASLEKPVGESMLAGASKATGFMAKTIESARAGAKQEDFCYYKKNVGNKRCRFTLLSPEAEKAFLIYTKKLKETAKTQCGGGKSLKIPRNPNRYLAGRSQEDAIARVANFAVKTGANVISMDSVKPSSVMATVYDCPGKVLNKMLRKISLRVPLKPKNQSSIKVGSFLLDLDTNNSFLAGSLFFLAENQSFSVGK